MHKLDFERLLATPSRSRSTHFAVHHVAGRPSTPAGRRRGPSADELSTGQVSNSAQSVDNSSPELWLGAVVPKRHARRAVTRSLLKRQIRSALERHAAALPAGLWLVRLRSPFPTAQFPSAASPALAGAARGELDRLLTRVQPSPASAAGAADPS